jgi:DNA polymerase elongation subunit (family B)
MSYVGYYQDNKNCVLKVSERINGKRICEDFPLILEYYVPDENGYYEGYDGKRLKKITYKQPFMAKKISEECKAKGIKTYELNFNLPNKVLYKYFNGQEAPKLHTSFIDIEVDRKGYEYLTVKELVDKACCPINAISIYNDWQDSLYTLMLRPENLTHDEAQIICEKFDKTFLFEDEKQLLNGIIALLDDADVTCGFNSSRFDFPYIVRRIENILGEGQSKRLCLWNIPPKEKQKKNDFGSIDLIYEFYGKWFSDYLELYKKHEQGKKESYKLDSIAELELGENKVEHDESLDDMYRQRYEDFIKYNRQDTMLVKKLEDKLKYIYIHNQQAHEATCSLEATMGTVAFMNQMVVNEIHARNEIVPDRDETKNDKYKGIIPPGAFVPTPIVGFCTNIMSFDLNSLYPSVLRSLNMSPETIVGQIRLSMTIPYLYKKIEENGLWENISKRIPKWGSAWAGDDMWGVLEYQEVMKKSDVMLTVDFETGQSADISAKDLYNLIFKDGSNLTLSGAGTIYRTDKVGIINQILTKWYSRRKGFKKEMAKYEDMANGLKIDDEELLKQLQEVLKE